VPLSSLEALFDSNPILQVKTLSGYQADGDGDLRHVLIGGGGSYRGCRLEVLSVLLVSLASFLVF
jgi:hypothetical protein